MSFRDVAHVLQEWEQGSVSASMSESERRRHAEIGSIIERLKQRHDQLEEVVGYALSVRSSNTMDWMLGFAREINRLLVMDGDVRRCVANKDGLFLQDVRRISTASSTK